MLAMASHRLAHASSFPLGSVYRVRLSFHGEHSTHILLFLLWEDMLTHDLLWDFCTDRKQLELNLVACPW